MEQDFRSLLLTPADAPLQLTRALKAGADVVLLDLEDMVPYENKAQARASAAASLRQMQDRADAPRLFVRVNSLDSGLIDADLDAIMPGRPQGIMLPKSRSGMDVQHLAAKLAVQEAENDLQDGSTRILPLVTGSGAAIFGLSTYARASHRLVALAWGDDDLAADIGAEGSRHQTGSWSDPFALVRHLTLFAAAAAGVPAIDTLFHDVGDVDGLRHEAQQARADGFAAKLAIHPAQVAAINHVFTPTGDVLARAQALVAAFSHQPDAPGVTIDGHRFDRRHLARARRVLARAARAGQPPAA